MKNLTNLFSALFIFINGFLCAQLLGPVCDLELKTPSTFPGLQENKGQLVNLDHEPVNDVLFKLSGSGVDLYVTEKGLSYFFYDLKDIKVERGDPNSLKPPGIDSPIKWERIDMHLKNANISRSSIKKGDALQGSANYFLAHCPNGIHEVYKYQTVTISNVYPGIDWVLYNSEKNGLKYDFVVHPGADAGLIQLVYASLSRPQLDEIGNLKLASEFAILTENKPFVFIKRDQEIKSNYQIKSLLELEGHFETTIVYELVEYDKSKQLVIDPQLVWSTPFGGNFNESICSIAHDKHGNSYAVGMSQSPDFPVQTAGTYFQGTVTSTGNQAKAIIMKFNSAGVLKWSTYYGGSVGDFAYSVTCDKFANVFVTGGTSSADFPLKDTGTYFQGTYAGQQDGFILKFDSLGNRIWATYYGGSQLDWFYSLSCDLDGNLYAAGLTYSADFPMLSAGGFFNNTPKAQGHNCGTVAKFSNNGTRMWSSYFTSDRTDAISAGDDGYVYITGFTYDSIPTFNPGNGAYYQASGGSTEAYIAKFHSSTTLVWSTYYGGSKDDYGRSILADKKGNVFMCGTTRSRNLPVLGPENTFQDTMSTNSPVESDGFITKFGPNGALLWATYFGAPNYDEMSSADNLALDACDRVYFSMETSGPGASTMAPCEGGYTAGSHGAMDEVIARFSNQGTLQWCTYFGGSHNDTQEPLEIDLKGDLLTGGRWEPVTSTTYTYPFVNPGGGAFFNPTINGFFDAAIAKFKGGVIDQAIPQFTYAAICEGQASTIVPTLSSGFTSGGQFRAQGIAIDPNTGLVNVTNVPPGIYPVSYAWLSCECKQSRSIIQIVDCSALDEQQTENTIEVYSNPNDGNFVIQAKKPIELKLLDEFGRQLQLVKLTSKNNFKTTVTLFASGVYILSGNGYFKKVVVIR